MRTEIIQFTIFWGVWVLVPIIVDGLATLSGLIGYFIFHFRNRKPAPALSYCPNISIIIPVYNGEKTLAVFRIAPANVQVKSSGCALGALLVKLCCNKGV